MAREKTDEEKRRTCICCGEEKQVLLRVEATGDSFLTQTRGVCQDCVKSDKDIEEITTQYEIDKAQEGLKKGEETVRFYKEELNKLKSAPKQD